MVSLWSQEHGTGEAWNKPYVLSVVYTLYSALLALPALVFRSPWRRSARRARAQLYGFIFFRGVESGRSETQSAWGHTVTFITRLIRPNKIEFTHHTHSKITPSA